MGGNGSGRRAKPGSRARHTTVVFDDRPSVVLRGLRAFVIARLASMGVAHATAASTAGVSAWSWSRWLSARTLNERAIKLLARGLAMSCAELMSETMLTDREGSDGTITDDHE